MEYTINQASKLTNVSSYTLRYYEKEGLLLNIKRNKSDIRIYDDDNIFWIGLVRCLRDTGMPISEIKNVVKLSKCDGKTLKDSIQILIDHRVNIENQIENLKHCMKLIDYKLKWFENC